LTVSNWLPLRESAKVKGGQRKGECGGLGLVEKSHTSFFSLLQGCTMDFPQASNPLRCRLDENNLFLIRSILGGSKVMKLIFFKTDLLNRHRPS
jgi:hypothetical protein